MSRGVDRRYNANWLVRVIDAMCLGCSYLAIALLLPILVYWPFGLVSCYYPEAYDRKAKHVSVSGILLRATTIST
jgi:hypothetical protein